MTETSPAATRARPVLERLGAVDLLDLVPRLSLLLLVLNAGKDPVVMVGGAVAILVGFLNRQVYTDGRFWLVVGALLVGWNLTRWEGLDNHVWLTAWWVLALGCSLLTTRPRLAMALAGRLLIGLGFALAVIWKLTSGEYMDGSFFHFSALLDDRFRYLTESVGSLSSSSYDGNLAAYAARSSGEVVHLATTGRVRILAGVLTWWTLAIEAAVAVAFLAWRGSWRRLARPLTLGAFCLTTYLAVPVAGFGCLLVTMELPDEELSVRVRGLFVVGFVALALWPPLWRVLLYR